MISLGLRLVINGGREAIVRLVILTVAVSLGVGLLLTAVAATNATITWNNRHAWYWTGTSSEPAGPATAGVAPLWWHPSGDLYDGQTIVRFDVAATGASSPVPPGIPRDPAPGPVLRLARADHAAARRSGRAGAPASPAAWPGRSAMPRCRRLTRSSSSSGAPLRSWRTRPTASG